MKRRVLWVEAKTVSFFFSDCIWKWQESVDNQCAADQLWKILFTLFNKIPLNFKDTKFQEKSRKGGSKTVFWIIVFESDRKHRQMNVQLLMLGATLEATRNICQNKFHQLLNYERVYSNYINYMWSITFHYSLADQIHWHNSLYNFLSREMIILFKQSWLDWHQLMQ